MDGVLLGVECSIADLFILRLSDSTMIVTLYGVGNGVMLVTDDEPFDGVSLGIIYGIMY